MIVALVCLDNFDLIWKMLQGEVVSIYMYMYIHIILKPQSDDFEGDTELTDSVKCPQLGDLLYCCRDRLTKA